MNGRVYDPVLARFLSPDPVVQDQTDLQAFNRYSYVMNNPLNATDPSGYYLDPIQQVGKLYGTNFSVNIQQVMSGNFSPSISIPQIPTTGINSPIFIPQVNQSSFYLSPNLVARVDNPIVSAALLGSGQSIAEYQSANSKNRSSHISSSTGATSVVGGSSTRISSTNNTTTSVSGSIAREIDARAEYEKRMGIMKDVYSWGGATAEVLEKDPSNKVMIKSGNKVVSVVVTLEEATTYFNREDYGRAAAKLYSFGVAESAGFFLKKFPGTKAYMPLIEVAVEKTTFGALDALGKWAYEYGFNNSDANGNFTNNAWQTILSPFR